MTRTKLKYFASSVTAQRCSELSIRLCMVFIDFFGIAAFNSINRLNNLGEIWTKLTQNYWNFVLKRKRPSYTFCKVCYHKYVFSTYTLGSCCIFFFIKLPTLEKLVFFRATTVVYKYVRLNRLKTKVKEVWGLTQQSVHDLFQPVMNEVRVSFVKKAFRELDKTGDEVLTVDDLKEDYIVKHHPKFQNKEETEQDIVNKYLSNFEKDKNGKVMFLWKK